MKNLRHHIPAFALALGVALLPSAYAHGPAGGEGGKASAPISAEEKTFGMQGDPAGTTRTIIIDMKDTMRFIPSELRIRPGETVRFVVKNKGRMMHELVLGTLDELKKHGEMMRKFPGMEHDEPYMAHVPPGKKGDLVWRFTQPGEFHYACLIPGHFEAGMIGKITVTPD